MPMKLWIGCLFLTLGVFELVAQKVPHENFLVSTYDSPNEPSIAFDPKRPDIVVAAHNTDNVWYSTDGGHSWKMSTMLETPYGIWGDPVLEVDTNGHFYYFHLSNPAPKLGNFTDRIVCQKSTDGGKTWSKGTYMGLNGKKVQDKEWAYLDRQTNHLYVTWTEFDRYESENELDRSNILFSKSTDGGETWSKAVRINQKDGNCTDSDGTVEGAVPAVGPNGEVYVAWASKEGIVFDRSLDGGATWMKKDIIAADLPNGWDFEIPGIRRCNGFPVTVCDLSGGPNHGTIYINWTDTRNGKQDSDVWLIKSKDGGLTWTDPVRVNDDPPGKHQFFTWMDIDQSNGHLYFVFYDKRHYVDNEVDVYMAQSKDGGKTFANFRVNKTKLISNSMPFFGDYINVVVHDHIVRPIWTQMNGLQLSIIMAEVDVEAIPAPKKTKKTTPSKEALQAKGVHWLGFKLRARQCLTLLVEAENSKFKKKVFARKCFLYGTHYAKIDYQKLKLKAGKYAYSLKNKKRVLLKGKFKVNP